MSLLIGALTLGFLLGLLALGVFLSFRIFHFPDITADGSLTLGAAVAAVLLVAGHPPWLATTASFAGGLLAGALTGLLHTRFRIHGLLSGILVMTALYSVNLHVMGRSNLPLRSVPTLGSGPERAVAWLADGRGILDLLGWDVPTRDVAFLLLAITVTLGVAALLAIFLRTNLGGAMRAAGDNPAMIRALGVNVDRMMVLGLALSNGLIALCGSLLAQYQGFSDVQMGIGMVVWGLASVILGEALVGGTAVGLLLVGAVLGSVLFRLLLALALRAGLDPNDLKLVTALFVFAALVLPGAVARGQRSLRGTQR